MGPTSLSLVRALGRKNIPVYGIGLTKFEAALSSKYCKSIGAADPNHAPDKMLALLLEFAGSNSFDKKPVLYPTGDECVVFIAKNYEVLSKFYKFSTLNEQISELFLDKGIFYKACLQHGLPTALSLLPSTVEELSYLSKDINYPCIMKPRHYHEWALTHGLVKGIVCNNEAQLLHNSRQYRDTLDQFIIQEIITGPETDIYVFAAYFDRTSHPHGIFIGNKIRQYPVGFGTTTMMKTAEDAEIIEMSVQFLESVNYQGLCDVEYKLDRKTNTFKIIEINPRMGRWYGIVEASGLDTIYYSFLDLTDQPIPNQNIEIKPVTWAFVSRDIPAIINNKSWSLSSATRSYSGRKTWCIWAMDDVKPFFAYFSEMAMKVLRQLTRKYS